MQDPILDGYGMEPDPYGDMPMGDVVPFPAFMPPQEPEELVNLRRQLVLFQRLSEMDNAAEAFEPDQLSSLGAKVVREYDIDLASRADWETTADRAMEMARQVIEKKSHPWEGASNVKYPMLTTAALQFAARAYPAIVDGSRIVKPKILGADPNGVKAGKADRVSQHMSYQLMHEMPCWESDLDTALHQIPIIGCAFRKVYADPLSEAGVTSELVSAFDLVVNQAAKSLETVPRITHRFKLYPHEIREKVAAGEYIDFSWATSVEDGSDAADDDAPHMMLEQHRYWDSDGDGMPEPWIVTVHKETRTVVRLRLGCDVQRIVANQFTGKIVKMPRERYFVMIPFLPDPQGGFYAIGFGKLLAAISDAIDTTINQMMDAGTLANVGGGFLGAGVNVGKSKVRLRPGEYTSVQAAGPDIRQSLVTLDFPGPNATLFNLLGLLIDAGKDIASIKDVLTGETPNNQTATSTMAAIEQGLKVSQAIYKRVFRALKEEFKLIYDINKRTMVQPKVVRLLDDPVTVSQIDYDDELDVVPMADPNNVTDMQRLAKAQFLLEQVTNGNPHIDSLAATRRALEAARIEDVESVLVQPQPPGPLDQLQVEGAQSEVDKIKADTFKAVADGVKTFAEVGIAVGPAMIPEPTFIAQDAPIGPQLGAPVPPEMMGGMDQMPPEMMGLPPEAMMQAPPIMPEEAMPADPMAPMP